MFRKTKKGLVAVVLTLSLSSVMAAMSYSSASVTNDMSVKLTDTSSALLALEPSSEHNAATDAHITANMLKLDLSKGYNNGDFGVQPNSTYSWNDLFKVKNNSEHEVTVSIKTNPNVNDGRIQLFASADGNSWTRISNIHSQNPGGVLTFVLPANTEKWIDVKTAASNGHVKVTDLDLIVEAVKN
ncbi:hypothetical protein JOC95_000397 [Bacillus tianshenii]|uniref:F5/8 type C domain-containing protein n=1 Tax=Sutcliffiella tianshenii TaxID=1463404 RepID=A0ABS2NV70_9BACI|nr:DUF1102 domain-containing protein [Bacillus tianshenii]MBM7618555.1 hypothetical protein [Bacillus tianshenii]